MNCYLLDNLLITISVLVVIFRLFGSNDVDLRAMGAKNAQATSTPNAATSHAANIEKEATLGWSRLKVCSLFCIIVIMPKGP